MSYNENEIIKLKHLDELAAQIHAKLDRKQKTARRPQLTLNSTAYDGSLARVPLSVLKKYGDIYPLNGSLHFQQEREASLPTFSDFNVSEGNVSVALREVHWYSANPRWYWSLALSDSVPCKFSFKCRLPEVTELAAWDQLVNVEVYDDTEEGD